MRPSFALLAAASSLTLALPLPSRGGEFEIGGYVHYYWRDFHDTVSSSTGETSEVRRVRPVFEYRAERWSARFMPDLEREQNKALDAYIDITPDAGWDLRIGRFKSSPSIDQLKSTNAVAATELSGVAAMTPSRDNGILLGLGAKDARWRYEFGVFDGAADDQVKGSLDGGAEGMARFVGTFPAGAGKFRFGLGGTSGRREGEPGQARLARYQTPGRSTWFRYRGDAYADGSTSRLVGFADYYGGPAYAQLEAARSSETVRLDGERTRLSHTGWEAQAGYVLTGDARTYGGVKPGNFVLPGLDLPVAVELTGRVGRVRVDDNAFDFAADPLVNGREAGLAGLALGFWFPNKWRLTTEFEVTRVTNAATGARDTERAVIANLVMVF